MKTKWLSSFYINNMALFLVYQLLNEGFATMAWKGEEPKSIKNI